MKEFVSFYADVFGCRLIGVTPADPERVRTFFGVDAEAPECDIGWLRTPGGGILELFEFKPHQPAVEVPWNRIGLTHFGFDVVNTRKWHDYLVRKGVEIVSEPEGSPRGHTFFFARDCDGNLIELMDLGYKYHLLKWLGGFAGWLFRRGMNKDYYELPWKPRGGLPHGEEPRA
jgi:catechol 2,3-dioxygenase-like lactoylglutathione lyase family enzyme